MTRFRTATIALAGCVLVGCSRGPLPTSGSAPLSPARENYPSRAELLVLAVPTGTPPRYPTPGFAPVQNLRLGSRAVDPEFAAQLRPALGKTILDPLAALSATQRDDITQLLDGYFGTPAAPTVHIPNGIAAERLALYEFDPNRGAFANLRTVLGRYSDWLEAASAATELRLTDESLSRGGVLYRRWCHSCHGPTGGGDGTQSAHFGAVPRDYRQGVFKYGSSFPTSEQPRKGERGKLLKRDLKRTIQNGLDGSMMPGFPLLSELELDDLAGYVIHLSARGEVEFEVMARVIRLLTNPADDDPEYSHEFLERLLDYSTIQVVGNWGRAERSPIPIPPENCPTEEIRWESAIRGYKAFSTRGCLGCHDGYGRIEQLKYDVWGTVVRPRDLTLGVFRGGRQGVDLYSRVYAGIVPATMPDFTANLKQNAPRVGQPDEIWDIVHFLQALADPKERQSLEVRLHRAKETDPSLTVTTLN